MIIEESERALEFLDRRGGWAKGGWRMMSDESAVSHFTRTLSDHRITQDWPDFMRAQAMQLLELISRRHDAEQLLTEAVSKQLGLLDTLALLRRPRVVK